MKYITSVWSSISNDSYAIWG